MLSSSSEPELDELARRLLFGLPALLKSKQRQIKTNHVAPASVRRDASPLDERNLDLGLL